LLRELDIARVFVDFPDDELLALLTVSHYVAMPYKVEETPTLQLGQGLLNTTTFASNTERPAGNTVSTSAQQNVISGVQQASSITNASDLSA
jgi:hypothetical protein